MSRRACKVDNSQRELVPMIRALGASFQSTAEVGDGCPDGVVGFVGVDVFVEFKTGKAKLRPEQERWAANWRGAPRWVLRTPDDVGDLLKWMRGAKEGR